jgi:hypothetical protein
MNGESANPHLGESLIERYADGDLSLAEGREAEAHLSACSACRKRVDEYHALFGELAALPFPAVPAGFGVRILDAVRPSEEAVLLRWVSQAYVVLAVVLAAVGAGVLGVSGGPGPVAGTVAGGFSRILGDGFVALRNVVVSAVDLLKAVLELMPVAGVAGPLARGLETTASAVATQYSVILILTCVLATLVLAWATSPARERGVPHVSLSL